MQVREVMTPNVEVVPPEATLQQAAQKMKSMDVGPMPICDGERVLGMVTDRDITVRATAEGLDPKTTPVANVMTPEVVFCFEDQDVSEAARIMQEKQIRRLLVMSRDKKLVGIVSLGDLAVDGGSDNQTGETLERVSEPAQPQRAA
jgi:CBS domain-containing protein